MCCDLMGRHRHPKGEPVSVEDNTQVARRYLDEVLNGRDFAAAPRFFTEDATDHLAGSMTAYLTLAAFPDFELNTEHMVVEDDMVTVLATFTGTHRGEFMGLVPTDQGVTGRAAFAFRIFEGRIAATWAEIEPWGLLQQLGAPAIT
jgi:predicted ester cyclase